MRRVFFYGLFMDTALLQDMGFHPASATAAKLQGYQIHIGNKATLKQRDGSTSYGMLIELPDGELSALYSTQGVSDYIPVIVKATAIDDGTTQEALCYVLAPEQPYNGFNREYASKLAALLVELGFPETYARELKEATGP